MRTGSGTAFAIANHAAAVLFVISAGLQYNDPDPLRWGAIYAAAALACWLHRRTARSWLLPAAVGVVALGWAGGLAPSALPGLELGDLVKTMEAQTPSIELGREFLGLAIVAAWMAVLVVSALRARA